MSATLYNPDGYEITVINEAPPPDPSAEIARLEAELAAAEAEVASLEEQLADCRHTNLPNLPKPFPSGYTVPVGAELAFSDTVTNTGTKTAASWQTLDDRRGGGYSGGGYWTDHQSRINFKNKGGDWRDADGVEQGSKAYGSVSLPYGIIGAFDIDVSALVGEWCGGVSPNYGFLLMTDGGCTLTCPSRFDANPVKRPKLLINGIEVPCARSQWIVTTQNAMTGLGNNPTMKISPRDRALLWFDISTFVGQTITSAKLSINSYGTYDGPWPMVLKVMRLWNPGDQGDMPKVELGIAKDYILDAGIENHPDVIMAQNLTDPVAAAAWLKGTSGELITEADSNGFSPPGGLPGVKITFYPPIMSAFQKFIPLPEGTEHAFMRQLDCYGLDFDPKWNPSGKDSGWDMSYYNPLHDNMGCGHGSSGVDPLTGGSARKSYGSPSTGGDPLAGFVPIGHGGCYTYDSLSSSGSSMYFGNKYLSMLRKGEWYSVESELQMNGVDFPLEIPRKIISMTQVNGLATATFLQPQDWASFPAQWTFGGGSWSDTSMNYSMEHDITPINPTQCTFTVPVATVSPGHTMTDSYNNPLKYFLGIPGRGRRDGILRLWINGMLAGEWLDMRFRASRLRPDGGIFGIHNAWLLRYTGGRNPPTYQCSSYKAAFVVAKSYIGPMMVAK